MENDGYVVGDVPACVANYTFHPALAPLVPPSNILASIFLSSFLVVGPWSVDKQNMFFFLLLFVLETL